MLKDVKEFIMPAYITEDAEIARKKWLFPATYNNNKTLSDKQISQLYVDTIIIGGGNIIDFAHKLIEESQERNENNSL